MIKSYRFTSNSSWKRLLVLWAIHGNETCGTKAIFDIINQINNNNLLVEAWEVVFIPISNPLAYKQNTRFVENNLNRIFKHHINPISYEEKLANELIKFVDDADYVLDLHSFAAGNDPFVFQDYVWEDRKLFAKSLNISHVCVWWPEAFENQWIDDVFATETYAYKTGKVAVTVECGSHKDQKSVEIAKSCVLNSLSYLGISPVLPNINLNVNTKFIKINKVFRKIKKWIFVQKRQHLDFIKKEQKLIEYEDWASLNSDRDCYILLPKINATIWEEWFYLWDIE